MAASFLGHVLAMRVERDGRIAIITADGQCITDTLGYEVFEPTSMIASSTYLPQSSQLHIRTIQGDDIALELLQPADGSPLGGRPTIYLDQNHWSTITNTIYEPDRVANEDERTAAARLAELAMSRTVVLPLSAAHMSETCKQVDVERRYKRGLTIAQLSGGWHLRDPLELRAFELQQVLITHYHHRCLIPPAAVTLQPGVLHSGRGKLHPNRGHRLPQGAQQVIDAIGWVDVILDMKPVPMAPVPGWAANFQEFAICLMNDRTGKEMKRRRTYTKFISDLQSELGTAAHRAEITTGQLSDWILRHGEEDMREMPAVGMFREVLHEKLSNGNLRWEENDLIDMMYLTTAAGYCDHVVGERAHTSHLVHASRRLGRKAHLHTNLRSLVRELSNNGISCE